MTKLWLRRILAATVLAALVTLFVSPIPEAAKALGWVPSWQLVPAILAGSAIVLVVLALLTILFGRIYCSVICPLGIVQDAVRFVAKVCGAPSRRAFASNRIRYVVLALFVPALVFGFGFLVEPYAIFSRFMTVIACGVEHVPVALSVFSIAFFAAIVIAAAVDARWWCNTICPVGALLGLFQRFAVFRLRIDNAKCIGCDLCARACDKGVIPAGRNKKLDHSRCVSCYACAGRCKAGALKFKVK